MKTYLTICWLLISGYALSAQSACPCCSASHQQFDFWVGSWIVKDTSGTVVGKNKISKKEDGCIVAEHWEGQTGVTGRSYNYYDSTDSTWNQLWLDNKGGILKLRGIKIGQAMILKSAIVKNKANKPFYHQVSWTPAADGSVTQLWETYTPEGERTAVLFLGIYYSE